MLGVFILEWYACRMSRYVKLTLYSVVAATLQIIYIRGIETQPLEGWGDIAQGLEIFFSTIALSIVLAVVGYRSAAEHKVAYALGWLPGSFAIIAVLNIVAGQILR